ncbi:tetratricopeptide repeat protein [Azospirillum doebereinerae]|uniref:Tetratricopeptide repeat protein n=1 Tax=Azospirillum doebereinerae TaxID=92933 RepID=A0A3S0V3M9_9PROT|nr:tetratricopeptide repeat protein [Azospirillum doebereinerae]MCG5243046.1 tetratricopeptide repeat protein [Azospirillum doebereinerae]RUQ65897.1 tetratricopeptide repeat protein [Azospirillum doebereinerae]
MTDTPAPTLLDAARLFRANDLPGAEAMCRALLAADPHHAQALHLLGLIAAHTGHPDDALSLFAQAIAEGGSDASFHNSRGSLLFQLGRAAEAEESFRAGLSVNAKYPELHGNLGNALKALGRLEEAAESFRAALDLRPEAPEMHHFLATTLRELGELEAAEAHLRKALDLAPDYLEAHYNLAELLSTRGRLKEAEDAFRVVLAAAPRFVPAQVGLAHVLQSLDRASDAIEAIEAAREQAPDHPLVQFTRRLIYSNAVPGWHLPMINDFERNEAYKQSLERAVKPDSLVLEIGTGSGIVAMMAARAGAKQVVTCEVNPILARVAKETVANNGYADRVTVVPRLSTQLTVGAGGDLPEKADVFVSELINIGMLAPRMLSVLQHARTHLVKPGGAIIPRASTVYAMLIETPELARINPVKRIDGFDMSTFDVFRSPGYQQLDLGADAHTALSDSFTALDFDFTRNMPEDGEREIAVTVTKGGTCHGVAFWFDLFMDEEVVYKSESRSRTNHWKQAMTFLDAPIQVLPGDTLRVVARYDNNQISFGIGG